MAALMQQQTIYVLTHDSIGLGEDGPTHQPIEHLNMCRMTPNVRVWRPCDTVETFAAWQSAIQHKVGPTVLALSRQALNMQPRDEQQIKDIAKGGYILYQTPEKTPEIILMATGSEVEMTRVAAIELEKKGHAVRLVSMPCVEVFLRQTHSYQDSVLPESIVKRVAVEAGSTGYWLRFVGSAGEVVGIDRFGESAPAAQIYEAFGLTSMDIEKVALRIIKRG